MPWKTLECSIDGEAQAVPVKLVDDQPTKLEWPGKVERGTLVEIEGYGSFVASGKGSDGREFWSVPLKSVPLKAAGNDEAPPADEPGDAAEEGKTKRATRKSGRSA